jgi:hypothetical protein
MPSLDTLPTEIIEEITQLLDTAPRDCSLVQRLSHPRKDLLALCTASRRMRDIFFDKTWVEKHVMALAPGRLLLTLQNITPSMRSKVEYVILWRP